jgi:hypothetical protein
MHKVALSSEKSMLIITILIKPLRLIHPSLLLPLTNKTNATHLVVLPYIVSAKRVVPSSFHSVVKIQKKRDEENVILGILLVYFRTILLKVWVRRFKETCTKQ